MTQILLNVSEFLIDNAMGGWNCNIHNVAPHRQMHCVRYCNRNKKDVILRAIAVDVKRSQTFLLKFIGPNCPHLSWGRVKHTHMWHIWSKILSIEQINFTVVQPFVFYDSLYIGGASIVVALVIHHSKVSSPSLSLLIYFRVDTWNISRTRFSPALSCSLSVFQRALTWTLKYFLFVRATSCQQTYLCAESAHFPTNFFT